jgi:hypothetical protein
VWLWDAGTRRGVTDDETRALQAAEALIRSGQAASARVEKAHLVTGIRALESGYTRTGHGCRITCNAATSQGTTVEPLSAPLPPYVNYPNVARVYDYLLGGKDNFHADREAAERLIAITPDVLTAARQNRQFMERVVRYLVGQAGIRQIIDIGTGYPASNNVHQVVQDIAPETRVVYVDYDPVVTAHARAVLAKDKNVQVVESDMRHPRQVIGQIAESSDLIDLTAPVGVLMLAVLHFITDAEDPWSIAATFKNVMAPGSYLAVTHITDDGVDPDVAKAAQDVYAGASAPAVPRRYAEILRFFDGMELVPRGLTDVNAWPFTDDDRKINPRVLMYGGVARKF